MPKLPRITGQQAKKVFEKAGFAQDRMKAKPLHPKKPNHKYHLSIPMHAGKTLGIGLLKSLISAADLTDDEFIALMG